jgi:hypothetical protein
MLPTFVSHLEKQLVNQWVFQVAKESWEYICRVPPTASKTSLLKHGRQFCIRNLELFLYHPNHLYTFFVSSTFASGTCPTLYSSHILPPLDWHVEACRYAHTFFSRYWIDFPNRGKTGSCWRAIFFSIFLKNLDWEWDLETLGDALS